MWCSIGPLPKEVTSRPTEVQEKKANTAQNSPPHLDDSVFSHFATVDLSLHHFTKSS